MDPQQVLPTITPTPTKAKNMTAFRSFVLKQNPNLTKAQLSQLDDFVQRKQAEYLLDQGLPLDKLPAGENVGVAYDKVFKSNMGTPSAQVTPTKTNASDILGIGDKTGADLVQKAKNLIQELEGLYFGQQGQQPLAYSKPGELRIEGRLKNIERSIKGTEKGSDLERLNTYKKLLKSKLASLSKAAGDTGNIAFQEQILQLEGLPDENATIGEAISLFSSARNTFGLDESPRLREAKERFSTGDIKTQQSQTTYQGNQPPQSTEQTGNILMDAILRGGNAQQKLSNQGLGGPNFLGKFLFPRASKVAQRQAEGGKAASLDEATGIGGEVLSNVLPFLGPGGIATRLAIGGAARGFTEPGADLKQRTEGAVTQGVVGFGLGKAGEFLNTILRPGAVLGGARDKVSAKLAKEGVKIGNDATQKVAKDMLNEGLEGYKFKSLIEKLSKGEQIDPRDAVKLLVRTGKKTFTKGGDFKTNKAGEYYEVLRETLREEFSLKSPKIIELTSKMHKIDKSWEMLRKILFYGGLAAGGVGGGKYLFDTLTGKAPSGGGQ